ERARRLVAAAAANLDHRVDGLPGTLGAVQLRDRRLDPEIAALVVGHARADVGHRLQAEARSGDQRDLLRDGVVLAQRRAPLAALVGPLAHDLQRVLGLADADRGERQAAGVERAERDLQALAD